MNIAQFIVSILILVFLIVDKIFLSKHLERKQDIIDNQSTLVDDVTKSLGVIKEGKETEIKMKEMTIKELEEKSNKRGDAALLMFKEWKAVFSFAVGIFYSVPLTSDIHEEVKHMPECVSKNAILEALNRRQQIYIDAFRKAFETDSKYKSLLNKPQTK